MVTVGYSRRSKLLLTLAYSDKHTQKTFPNVGTWRRSMHRVWMLSHAWRNDEPYRNGCQHRIVEGIRFLRFLDDTSWSPVLWKPPVRVHSQFISNRSRRTLHLDGSIEFDPEWLVRAWFDVVDWAQMIYCVCNLESKISSRLVRNVNQDVFIEWITWLRVTS